MLGYYTLLSLINNTLHFATESLSAKMCRVFNIKLPILQNIVFAVYMLYGFLIFAHLSPQYIQY